MIRLRNKKGEIISTEEIGFVEVCDLDGNVSCAVYPDLDKRVHIITKSSKDSVRYEKIFNVKFSKIVTLPQELFDDHV